MPILEVSVMFYPSAGVLLPGDKVESSGRTGPKPFHNGILSILEVRRYL